MTRFMNKLNSDKYISLFQHIGRNGSQLPDEETKSAPSSPTMTGKRHYDISNAISGGGGLIRNSTDLNLKA